MRSIVASLIVALILTSEAVAGPLDDARRAFEGGDYAAAIGILRPLAEQGDAASQDPLGLMYAKGEGVPQDYAEAVKWYRLAAEQGFAGAQYYLGRMYAKGNGVPQDYVRAHMWFNLAATNGLNEAAQDREKVAAKMTPPQIAEAQAAQPAVEPVAPPEVEPVVDEEPSAGVRVESPYMEEPTPPVQPVPGSQRLDSPPPALGKTGDCSFDEAIYSAPLGEKGDRIEVEFMGDGNPSGDSQFVVTAIDSSGRKLWRHAGTYWCAMGSHGCSVRPNYQDPMATAYYEQRLRIEFVAPTPKSDAYTRSIIVVAGLSQAFWYYWHHGGLIVEQLTRDKPVKLNLGEFDRADLGEELALISEMPSAFYFERCKSAVEAAPSE